MLALTPRVLDVVWEAVEPLLPEPPPDTHPLGCHRRRLPDRACFEGILFRLVTGCSWAVAGGLGKGGETTLRRRRDEWLRAGVFSRLVEAALDAYDRVIGLDLSDVAIDASQHKAPVGGPGTGPNHRDRGKLGWKWSMATDARGIPVGWTVAAANHHDLTLLDDTLDAVDARGLELELGRVHLDRGYDFPSVRAGLAELGLDATIPSKRRVKKKRADRRAPHVSLGLRWPIERSNSWLTNFGQLRRSTDRKMVHRELALDVAVALIIIVKLVKWHRRYGAVIWREDQA